MNFARGYEKRFDIFNFFTEQLKEILKGLNIFDTLGGFALRASLFTETPMPSQGLFLWLVATKCHSPATSKTCFVCKVDDCYQI
jgi:hypothetical protein